MPENAKPHPSSKRGRPPFHPTARHRNRVMLLAAAGLRELAIAAVLGICRRTLQTYFAAELATGRAIKRALNLERLEAAAKRGNVSAMKALRRPSIAVNTRSRSPANLRRHVGRPEAAVRERLTKPALEERAAATAGLNSDWSDDLQPPDWQQH
jgi:hypothetical protein